MNRVAVGAAAFGFIVVACDSDEPQTSREFDGTWTVESDEAAGVLDLPVQTTLTVEIASGVEDGVDQVEVSLGCGRHGGAAESMDPLSVPEPTVQSPACKPDVQAAEQRAADFVLGADALRIDDGRLLVVGDAGTLTLHPA